MAFVGVRVRARLESRGLEPLSLVAVLIFTSVMMILLLAVLHGAECGIWAAAYLWLGALESPGDALLFSVDSMTTRGASGLTLHADQADVLQLPKRPRLRILIKPEGRQRLCGERHPRFAGHVDAVVNREQNRQGEATW